MSAWTRLSQSDWGTQTIITGTWRAFNSAINLRVFTSKLTRFHAHNRNRSFLRGAALVDLKIPLLSMWTCHDPRNWILIEYCAICRSNWHTSLALQIQKLRRFVSLTKRTERKQNRNRKRQTTLWFEEKILAGWVEWAIFMLRRFRDNWAQVLTQWSRATELCWLENETKVSLEMLAVCCAYQLWLSEKLIKSACLMSHFRAN